jgi:hypothetical protein
MRSRSDAEADMKYMLLIYFDEQKLSEAEREACYAESNQLAHEIKAAGKFLGASPLQPVASATSLRIRDGKRLVTDGPFAETHEQLAGAWLFECADLDEALQWAARIPTAQYGSVEVRPLYGDE